MIEALLRSFLTFYLFGLRYKCGFPRGIVVKKVRLLACLVLIALLIGFGAALELEYKQAPARSETIQIWDEGNGYYLFDLGGVQYLRMTGFDASSIFLQALVKFENDHPEWDVVSSEPFIYDGEGGCYYYYIKCVPKAV